MNIAELFVNLGIKGSEKTVGALTGVHKGMGEVKSVSLEAKAAILAAMYALERLVTASGAVGTGLTNFNAITGLSVKQLQQYQYAARQMGVSNQEMEGTFKTLQSTMTKTLIGQGAPKGLARLGQVVGDIMPKDLLEFQKNPALLLQKLQEYVGKETNIGLRNEVLESFGVQGNMIAALVRGGFSPDKLNKAPTYSDQEIGSLDRANIAWSNLGNKIEMAVGKFNAKHGMELVKDITLVTNSVIKLTESLIILGEKMKIFEAVGWVFNQLAGSAQEMTGWLDGKRSFWGEDLDKEGKVKGGRSLTGKTLGNFFDIMGGVANREEPPKKELPHVKPLWDKSYWQKPEAIAPTPPPVQPGSGSTQNINVNQNLNFQHDGKDHKKTSDSVKKANQDAFRQFAQGQVS